MEEPINIFTDKPIGKDEKKGKDAFRHMEMEEPINIFTDKPIGKDEKEGKDEFRHILYADTVQKIIKSFIDQDKHDSINIGLFGKWGSGKTSILNLLEKNICEENINSYLFLSLLFSWDSVPGNDNKKLIRYFRDDLDIGWAENAEVRKSSDGMTISISKNENSAEIRMDGKKENAILKISDSRSRSLKVKKENGKLNIYDKTIKFVNFNAWKYSDESLRRQFLIFLDGDEEKGGLGTQIGVKDELYKSKQIGRSKVKFSWKYFFIALLLAIFCLPILIKPISDSLMPESVLVSIALIAAYLLYDAFKKEIIQKEQVTETFHRLDQPDQFEDRFKEIIKKAKKKWTRIVIAIDDIDRCREDKAIEMLRMIKNFLGEDDCIYIIPCDDGEIKKHLQKVMKYEEKYGDADEFLRKFFQVVLRIPPASKEIFFAYVLHRTTEAGFKENVGDVVCTALWEDPRRIKQFINNLTALRELAKAKETEDEGGESLIGKGAVTNNLPFLAKIEAIRAKWPDLFEKIQGDGALLETLEYVANNENELSKIFKHKLDEATAIIDKATAIIDKNDGLKDFLKETMKVKCDKHLVPVFFNLVQPPYISAIPDGERFASLVLAGATSPEMRREIVNKIKELIKDRSKGNVELKGKYTTAIKAIFDSKHKRGNDELAFNALNAMVEICPADFEEGGGIIGEENRARIGKWVAGILDDMWSRIIDKLIENQFSLDNLFCALKEAKSASSQIFLELKEKVDSICKEDPEKGKSLAKIIAKSKNKDVQKTLISAKVLRTLISGLNEGEISEREGYANAYFKFQKYADDSVKSDFLDVNLAIILGNKDQFDDLKDFALKNLGRLNVLPQDRDEKVFSWDSVPENDSENENLIGFLRDDLDIDWVENAKILKSRNGKAIGIFRDENSPEIIIVEEKKEATLKIRDGKTYYLKVKRENDKLNIYKKVYTARRVAKQLFDVFNALKEIPPSSIELYAKTLLNFRKMDGYYKSVGLGEYITADAIRFRKERSDFWIPKIAETEKAIKILKKESRI